MRTATITRTTAETDISLTLNLDGSGRAEIDTGCGFLNHMLTLFARHSRCDLCVICRGDVEVDDHHTVEDIGICQFNEKDVVRHQLVQRIIQAYEKYEEGKRVRNYGKNQGRN